VTSPWSADSDFTREGSVTIYTRTDREWTEATTIRVAEDPGLYFTRKATLSGDGGTLFVTAQDLDEPDVVLLSVHERSGLEWEPVQTIPIPEGYHAGPLAASEDGRVVALGSTGGAVGGPQAPGRVWVYTETAGAWSRTAELAAPDGRTNDLFGISVAMTSDGRSLAVGATGVLGTGAWLGAVYLFEDDGPSWDFASKLAPVDSRELGLEVAFSGDGSRVIAAGWRAGIETPEGPEPTGFLFNLEGASPTLEARLYVPDPLDTSSTISVALDADGSTAVIGSIDRPSEDPGLARVYHRTDASWAPIAVLADPDAWGHDRFGYSVAIGGGTVVVGAPRAGADPLLGAAYVFHEPSGFEVVVDPVGRTAYAGGPATFQAAVVGAATHATQWQVSDDGATWEEVPGATFDWYTFTPPLADAGRRAPPADPPRGPARRPFDMRSR
jgi:hypothetical protein